MIGNQFHTQSVAVPDFSLVKNQTVKRILIFLKTHLSEFEVLFQQSIIEIHLEDDISKELTRFFGDKARTENLLFSFNEKKGVDFTVFVHPYQMGASSIFMIEAKRLGKKKYDYVSGRTGGIERIKREQDEFGNKLNFGAMIGYIQYKDRAYWEQRINTWISELIEQDTDIEWSEKDKLRVDSDSDFSSLHTRVSKSPITLYHYWINLC